MSRSYRKKPYISVCNDRNGSSGVWKRDYNRAFRRTSKHKLKKAMLNDYEDYFYEELYKLMIANPWLGPSDGWYYYPMMSLDEYTKYPCRRWFPNTYEEYKQKYYLDVLRK